MLKKMWIIFILIILLAALVIIIPSVFLLSHFSQQIQSFSIASQQEAVLQFLSSLNQTKTLVIVVFGLLSIILFGIFYVRFRRLSQSLKQLQRAMTSVVDEGGTTRLPINEKDDIYSLEIAFNQMAEQLFDKLQILKEQNDRQLEIQQMRSEFVDNVSHELKTPLTSIRGFVDTLRSGHVTDPKVQARFLEIIDIETERLHQLIGDILELSEIEGMENDLELQHFDLSQLIYEVADLLADKAKDHQVTIVVEESEELPVLASRYRVKQILINLVDNAIKYNLPEGKIYMQARREPDQMISIRIKDTGEGIEREHLPRLFERFYRVDKSHSRDVGGTGLGLSIVKHIAQLYEGSATVESVPGIGSVFVVKLKIADDLT